MAPTPAPALATGAVATSPSTRSLIFDLFGDYSHGRGGRIRLRAIVELLELLDVDAPTTRVTMARLAKDGWFDTEREGRETTYALNDRSWRLLTEGRDRIFQRAVTAWRGTWYMVIYSVPESDRRVRSRVRRTLSWLGFGPLAASTWISPHDHLDQVKQDLSDEENVQLDLLRCSSGSLEVDREMAARAWDIAALSSRYSDVLKRLQKAMPMYSKGSLDPEWALVERVRLVNWYRRTPFEDPVLPREFLPKDWVGAKAHAAFIEAHNLLRVPAERHFARVAANDS